MGRSGDGEHDQVGDGIGCVEETFVGGGDWWTGRHTYTERGSL
jgi:hypothetical protein